MPRIRNHYEPAGGVTQIQWQEGRPNEHTRGLVLVEVWRSGLSFFGPLPRVTVTATMQVWVLTDGGVARVTHAGTLETIALPHMVDVRRWSRLPSRSWRSTVKIEGWE